MAHGKKRLSLRRSRSEEEMMDTLVQSMEAFPHEERVQYSCLKVMRHIILPDKDHQAEPSLEEEFKVKGSNDLIMTVQWMGMDQSTTLALILKAMEACPHSINVHNLAVGMLTDLCEATTTSGGLSVHDLLIELGALIRLSETMTYHRRSPVARKACRLHTKLSQWMSSSTTMESLSTLSIESKEEDESF